MKTNMLLMTAGLVLGGMVVFVGLKKDPVPPLEGAGANFRGTLERAEASASPDAKRSERQPVDVGARRSRMIADLSAAAATGSNPGKAAAMADTLTPGDDRDELLVAIARAWAIQSPDAARAWAESRKDPEERARLVQAIIEEREKRDAGEAPEEEVVADLTAAVQRIDADGTGEVAVRNLTGKWASRNYGATVDWVRQQPAGETRDHLMARVALVRSATSPAEAAALVTNEMSRGLVQNEAIISIVHQWARRDFQAAASWVSGFENDTLKQRALRELEGIASVR